MHLYCSGWRHKLMNTLHSNEYIYQCNALGYRTNEWMHEWIKVLTKLHQVMYASLICHLSALMNKNTNECQPLRFNLQSEIISHTLSIISHWTIMQISITCQSSLCFSDPAAQADKEIRCSWKIFLYPFDLFSLPLSLSLACVRGSLTGKCHCLSFFIIWFIPCQKSTYASQACGVEKLSKSRWRLNRSLYIFSQQFPLIPL